MSYGKIGLTTVAVTQDLLSGMPLVLKIKLIRLWNSLLYESGQPSAQLSKLIRLTACKKAMHAISRWYWTVYIPWLVASYDTHKGKRWLNSNPTNIRFRFISVLVRFHFISCCLVRFRFISCRLVRFHYISCGSRCFVTLLPFSL